MKKIVICEGSSERSFKSFLEKYDAFKPVTKLTCFFNNNNFLLTNYQVANEYIDMVLENSAGDEMHISDLNCGYGGQGPSTTARLMRHLGVSEEDAEEFKYHSGIEICFYSNQYTFFKKESFFIQYNSNINCDGFGIGKSEKIDILRRKVYMVNPHYNNFTALLNCFKKMQPVSLEYFIGKESPLENNLHIFDVIDNNYNTGNVIRNPANTKNVNLIIRGNLFDVICFVDVTNIITTANAVHFFLLKKPLYVEEVKGNIIYAYRYQEKFNLFLEQLKLFFGIKENISKHNVIKLSEREQMIWKYWLH